MLQNSSAVIERAEASSGSKNSIAKSKVIDNFVTSTYILTLKDEVLRDNR